MERLPEPELMNGEAQAQAYAEADFEEPNGNFLALFKQHFPDFSPGGYGLDLGCGPGDITLRFAEAYPGLQMHGVDGAEAMLERAGMALQRRPELMGQVELIHAVLPDLAPLQGNYRMVVSNSLLHHLHRPETLWRTIADVAAPGAPVLVMDLFRPANQAQARDIVNTYAAGEPEVLRQDFFNSLLAAFTLEEIQAQLDDAGLEHLQVAKVSDRHVAVWGHR